MREFFNIVTSFISTKIHFDIVLAMITFIIAVIVYIIIRKIIKTALNKMLQKLDHGTSKTSIYYILKNSHLQILSLFSFVVALYFLSRNILSVEKIFSKLSLLLLIGIITSIFAGTVEGLIRYTEADKRFQTKPYRSFAQVVMLLIYIAVAIIVICVITEKSPTALLTGLGAITAVISLMFHETILSFVSSVQISAYDLIRTGDWIEISDAGIDGEVVELSLHTIKVQNWDNSVSSVLTNNLIKTGFKNWRNMVNINARRVKRSMQLDATSVKFVDEDLKHRLEKFSALQNYFQSLEGVYDFSDDLNKKHITNLEAFKVYATKYLQEIPDLRKDLPLLVRTYAVNERGIALEIYAFSTKTSFVDCEAFLGKTLQDFLATLKYFDLKPFQISIQPV